MRFLLALLIAAPVFAQPAAPAASAAETARTAGAAPTSAAGPTAPVGAQAASAPTAGQAAEIASSAAAPTAQAASSATTAGPAAPVGAQAASAATAGQTGEIASPAAAPTAQSASSAETAGPGAPVGAQAASAPTAGQAAEIASSAVAPTAQAASSATTAGPAAGVASESSSASPDGQSAPADQSGQATPATPAGQTAPPAAGQTAPAAQAAAPAPKAEEKTENPAPSAENWLTGSVDVGYRWISGISGNFAEYRSVLDLGAGPRLFGLDLTFTDPKKRLFDRLDVRAYGWGGEPYTTAYLDARKQGVYDFTFDYRNIAYFNAVPSYANPLAPAGFDDQAYNERRRNYSLSLDLFPGKQIIPYLEFDKNSGYGNGVDMWVQGGNDEFPVSELFRDSTLNYRGGVRLEFKHFHVTLEQGGTEFKDDDQSSYSGLNQGDNPFPLLGQTLDLTSLAQAYAIRGHGPYTKALLTGAPASWINVYGQFLYSEPQTAVHFNESAAGNFLLESSLLFYPGQQTLGIGAAVQPHVTGTGGVEMRLLKRLRVMESVTIDRQHDAVSPLITTALLLPSSASYSSTSLNYSQVINYTQTQTDLIYDLTDKITLRAGYRLLDGSAVVLPGALNQPQSLLSGALRRNVALAGATYRATGKFSINLDYEGASSDRIYFRTDLNNYNKARARARYQLASTLTLQANFQVLNNQNPAAQIQYSFQSRDNSLAIYWTPKGGKRITFMGEYDRSTLNSSIDYLLPPTFSPVVSQYIDRAHTATSAIDVALPGLPGAKLEFGGSMFISSGSRASQYYQPLARLSIPVVKHLQWNSEWQWYGYDEQFYGYEAFRVHMFTTGLRYTR